MAEDPRLSELLDLARQIGGREGLGANHSSTPPGDGSASQAYEAADRDDDPAELERWTRFHEAVEALPVEEREVVSLAFYHGWTHGQIAELFGVDERTVRRRWRAACLRLHDALEGHLPELSG